MSASGPIESHRWMVVSDLDGTLLGQTEATFRFRDWWSQSAVPRCLVYASGRSYESIVNSIHKFQLPTPDAIVADVGTDVRSYPSGVPLIEWSSKWWSTWDIENVSSLLDSQPDLELQPSECQTTFKRSYFLRNPNSDWISRTQSQLREQRLDADLIYSSNRDLDVLPAGANKGTAIEFLAQTWKIPRTRVVVAGDSGNDLSMFVQGFRGIVVGNAQSELSDVTGLNIYRSQHNFADGVIDGLNFWMNSETTASDRRNVSYLPQRSGAFGSAESFS
jgi:sucrose-6F-phosphate phosphohydrolase